MSARLLAGFALLLWPAVAFAGLPITEFRPPRPASSMNLGADGLPIPVRAGYLSARNTLVPVAAGTIFFTLGASQSSAGGDISAGPGLVVVGLCVVTAGLLIGPSAGYSYGGIPGRGTAGTLVRIGTLIAPAIILGSQERNRGTEDAWVAQAIGLLLGAGVMSLEAVYDVATVEGTVRRHNATLAPAHIVAARAVPGALDARTGIGSAHRIRRT